jgi:hypothetical protein
LEHGGAHPIAPKTCPGHAKSKTYLERDPPRAPSSSSSNMPCSAPLGNVSLAPVRPSERVVPEPPIGPRILLLFFFTQIGGKIATIRAGGLEEGQGMGQISGNANIAFGGAEANG